MATKRRKPAKQRERKGVPHHLWMPRMHREACRAPARALEHTCEFCDMEAKPVRVAAVAKAQHIAEPKAIQLAAWLWRWPPPLGAWHMTWELPPCPVGSREKRASEIRIECVGPDTFKRVE